VDHHCTPIRVKDRAGRARFKGDTLYGCGERGIARAVKRDIEQVARVVAFGVVQAVLLRCGVEVPTGAREVRSRARPDSMNVDAVLARLGVGEALHLYFHPRSGARRKKKGLAYNFAPGILQLRAGPCGVRFRSQHRHRGHSRPCQ
jgi:hypothetical protein